MTITRRCFLGRYHERAYFFDVHPPLSKMLMLWVAGLFGFNGRQTCPYESTEPFAAECELHAQRLVPAICGAAVIPLAFASCRVMGVHPLAAALASWFLLVDTLWLGLSRLHLNDMVQVANPTQANASRHVSESSPVASCRCSSSLSRTSWPFSPVTPRQTNTAVCRRAV